MLVRDREPIDEALSKGLEQLVPASYWEPAGVAGWREPTFYQRLRDGICSSTIYVYDLTDEGEEEQPWRGHSKQNLL